MFNNNTWLNNQIINYKRNRLISNLELFKKSYKIEQKPFYLYNIISLKKQINCLNKMSYKYSK